MKRIMGLSATLIGFILLVRPNFNFVNFIEMSSYFLVKYWPLFLIMFGVFLQSGTKGKKKRR